MANSIIPKDWTVTKLGEITNIATGKKDVNEGHEDGKYPFFTCSQKEYRINEPSFDTEAILVAGNAYFNVKYYKGKFDAYQRTYVIDGFKDNIGPYLYYVLSKDVASLTTNNQGSAVKYIKLRDLTDFSVLLPPSNERSKIIDILRMVDSAIDNAKAVIDQTQILKKGLMQELFTRGIPGGNKKFKKTALGALPEEWEVLRLQDLMDLGYITSHLDGNHGGLYPRQNEFVDEGIPYITANSLIHEEVDMCNAKYLSEDRAKKFNKGVAQDGDILLAHNATVGPVAILKMSLPFIILSTSLTYYRVNPELMNRRFLLYFMGSDLFQSQLMKVMRQTTRNQVPITAQRKLYMVICKRDEQDAIAETLGSISNRIKTEIRGLNALLSLKFALMHVLLTGEIRIKA